MNFVVNSFMSSKETQDKIETFINNAEPHINEAITHNKPILVAMREASVSTDLIRRVVYDNMGFCPERFARELQYDYVRSYYKKHQAEIDNLLVKLCETIPYNTDYSRQSSFDELKKEYFVNIKKGCKLTDFTGEIYFRLRMMIDRKISQLWEE